MGNGTTPSDQEIKKRRSKSCSRYFLTAPKGRYFDTIKISDRQTSDPDPIVRMEFKDQEGQTRYENCKFLNQTLIDIWDSYKCSEHRTNPADNE